MTLALSTEGLVMGDSSVRRRKLGSGGSVIAMKDLGHRRSCWAIPKEERDLIQASGRVGRLVDSEGRATCDGEHRI